MVDFNINLVKTMVSTPEERAGFYNKMLIYLVSCAALMVGTAYLSSKHLFNAAKANKGRNQLVYTMSSMSDFGKSFFKDPEQAYVEFGYYADDLETLRSALEQRSQFLPVISQLFADFPDNVTLQSLAATAADNSIEFILVAPVIDEDGNDILRMLQTKWRDNENLWLMAETVTAVSSEREMMGDTLVASVTYKCILK
jgi:hypothetical protein